MGDSLLDILTSHQILVIFKLILTFAIRVMSTGVKQI